LPSIPQPVHQSGGGPTTAGIILAFEVAANLACGQLCRKAENKTFAFKRGAAISPGDNVLVVDDVFTTGGSVKEVIAAVKERRETLLASGCWWTAAKKSTIWRTILCLSPRGSYQLRAG